MIENVIIKNNKVIIKMTNGSILMFSLETAQELRGFLNEVCN